MYPEYVLQTSLIILFSIGTCFMQDTVQLHFTLISGTNLYEIPKECKNPSLESGILTDYLTVKSINGSSWIALTKNLSTDLLPTTSCKKDGSTYKINVTNCGAPKAVDVIVFAPVDPAPAICDSSCRPISQLDLQVNESCYRTNQDCILNGTAIHICALHGTFPDHDYTISNHFDGLIDVQSGNDDFIKLKKPIDFDTVSEYKFNLSVAGSLSPYVIEVRIHVLDEDDLGVAFEKNGYSCNITENSGSLSCAVQAHDLDKGLNDTILYKILSVQPNVKNTNFSIFKNGTIWISPLDRETQSTYVLSILAFQQGREMDRNNVTTVFINVIDMDDNSPVMTLSSKQVDLQENAPSGQFVTQVFATDKDEGKNAEFTFHFSPGYDSTNFTINKTTGIVSVGPNPPDREALGNSSTIILKIFANSTIGPNRSDDTIIEIRIKDVNDNSPHFTGGKKFTIKKTFQINTVIAQLNVTDADDGVNGKVNVSLEDTSTFYVNSTGALYLVRSLNETFQRTYVLTVTATDLAISTSDRRTTTIDVTVNVKDVNIHTPHLTITRNLNISEDSPLGTVVAEFTATDADPDDQLVFYLLHIYSDKFEILNNSITTKKALDREETSKYEITLVCNDSVHDTNQTFTIYLLDVNDNVPQFQNGPYNFSVDENNSSACVGVVKAIDADEGENSRTYFWIDKDSVWAENITINRTTGKIQTHGPLDREIAAYLSFTVFVSDSGNPSLMNETVVSVRVRDMNDNPPVFVTESQTVNIEENTEPDDSGFILKMEATDADNGENGTVEYVFDHNRTKIQAFKINNASGVLSMTANPKLYKCDKVDFPLHVFAFDKGSPQLNATVNITIHIIDVNDNPPKFTSNLKLESIEEPGAQNQQLVFLINGSPIQGDEEIARDADCDTAFKTLHYWMDNTDDRFQINSSNGFISLRPNKTLDYDPPVYDRIIHFTIFATDGTFVTNTSVSMNVTNAIDFQPYFSQKTYKCSVDENFTGETNCTINLIYLEPNNTFENQFIFRVNGSQSVNFTGNGLSQNLRIVKPFDFENEHVVTVTTCAINKMLKNISSSNCSTVIIKVLNVNDVYPKFYMTSNDYNFRFKEGNSANLSIGFVNVTDEDSSFTLMLTCNGSGKFFDVRANGDIWTNHSFDYEKDAHNFNCNIIANDSVKSVNKTVTINVENINDNYPQFGQPNYSQYINETHKKGDDILQITANDLDVGDTISFKIVGGDSMDLVITETTGVLSSNSNFSGPAELNIVVEACDIGTPQLCNFTDVAIHVLNVNNHPPRFSKQHPIVEIYENSRVFIAQLEATDFDGDNLSYTIANTTSAFNITGSSLYANNVNAEDFTASRGLCVLLITVSDGLYNDSTLLNITILDVNEFAPIFGSIHINTEINEILPSDSNILNITATDDDLSNTGFVFVLYNNEGIFRINDSTGEITLAKSVHHAVGSYNMTVVVYDNGHPSRSNSTTVTVAVKDVNEPPSVKLNASIVYLSSNSPIGTQVANINASDPDSDDLFRKLNFSIRVNSSDNTLLFVINNTCICTETQPLSPGNHSLNLTVMDGGGLTAWTNVLIVVYETKNYTKNIFVNETDKRNFSLVNESSGLESRLCIEPSVDMGKFTIIDTNLVMKDSFNREDTENVTLILHGFDVHDILVSIITINLTVSDINDCAPELDERYDFSINDDTENNTVVTQIIARDRDVMPQNRNVSYRIRGNGHEAFIMSSDGSLRVTSLQLYRLNEYNLTLEANDGLHNNTAILHITIVDTNDHSPVFTSNCTGPYLIAEDVNTGTNIGKLLTSDLDSGQNGNVTYSIKAGNENQTFSIETHNMHGIISTNSLLDRETRPSYVLTVVATDHALKNPRMAVCSVVITVLDVNDNTPRFLNPDEYKGSIAENASISTILDMHGALNAMDPDEGLNGTDGIVYRIVDNNLFLINPTNGTLSLNSSLDRETNATITLTVHATDSNGTGKWEKTTVVIEVIDVNDNPPVFVHENYSFNVTENVNSSEVVGVVNASDIDGPGNNNIRYRIVSGDFGRFYVDSLQGKLYAAGNIDRENNAIFNLNVSASDGTFSDFTSVTIHVNDVNDNAPRFENVNHDERIYIDVNESAISPGIIYRVQATDNDDSSSCNSRVQYELVNNTVKDITIDNTTGEITINGPVDRETQDAYTMYVSASDCGNPALSSILLVEIQILDINDNAPIFHNSNGEIITSVNASIIEESPVGSVIALLNATDLDAGQNGLVNYLFEPSSAVSDLFQINNKNGIVQLKEPIIINSLYHRKLIDTNDTNNVVLNMTVIARDSGAPNKSSQLNLFVNIEPINDNAPMFPKFLFTYSVLENSAQDTFVGQCEASIRNESISHMTYSLMEKFDSFAIDSYGNITTTRSLDRESKDMYMLTVRVTDGRTPERTAFAAVNVTVQDVNDKIPQFEQTETELTVPEETFISRNISVGASDRDFGINAALTYYLEESNDTRFAVDNTSGVLFLNGTFDYEHQTQYNLTVVVRDGGNPQFNNSKTIVLLISDVNDNYPIFHDQPENCSLEENLTIGTKVISVNASDADSGWNGKVFYRILDDDNCPFSINFLTGEIQTDGPLDYEQRGNCTLTVQASDMGTPPLTANMTLTVNILDVYDVIPRFERPVYQVTLYSSYSNRTQFVTVNSSGSGLHYSLKDDFDGLFQIADDGVLSLAKDISEAAVYRSPFVVNVSVTDQLNTSASCLVIVRIVKEEAVVPGSVMTSYVSEAASIGGLVADVNTTAEIAGEAVQYSIISVKPADSNGMFNITSNDGKVYFYRKLDRETHHQYVLNISFQHAVQQRTRRSVTNSGSFITLVVSILDENDNKPEFVDVPQTIDIPYDMGANKNVTRVKAIDRDIKTDTEMTYFIIGGDNDTFSINNVSGFIETRVPVSWRNSNSFHLTILARNGPNENDSAQANVAIQVKPTDQVVVFTVKQNVSSVWKNKDYILGNISDVLLDIEVKLQSVQPHIEKSYPPFNSNNTDAARTDLFIYGVNKTSREIVSREQMRSIMQSHITELNKKLGTLKRYDPSAISNSQLAIIAFAIAIFFGALIAIVFAIFGWSRYEEEVLKFEQFREHHDHHEHEDYELSTIGSRQASQLSSALAAASAVNPVYAETMLSDSFSQLSPKKKKETVYETQEVTMEFRDEHLDIPPASTGESARSIVDSGVGTTSGELDANPEQSAVIDIETPRTLDGTATGMDETDDAVNGTFPIEDDGDDVSHTVANVEKTGPVMTSSPRASRPLKLKDTGFAIQLGQGSENSRNDRAGSRDDSTIEQEQSGSLKKRRSTKGGVKFVSFVDIGETETDDEFDNEDEKSVEEHVTEEATEMSAQAVSTDNAREEDAEQLNEVSAAQSSIINQSLQLSEGNAEALAPTIRADDDQKSESRKHVHFTGIHESSNNAKSRSEDIVDDGDDPEYKMTSF